MLPTDTPWGRPDRVQLAWFNVVAKVPPVRVTVIFSPSSAPSVMPSSAMAMDSLSSEATKVIPLNAAAGVPEKTSSAAPTVSCAVVMSLS